MNLEELEKSIDYKFSNINLLKLLHELNLSDIIRIRQLLWSILR